MSLSDVTEHRWNSTGSVLVKTLLALPTSCSCNRHMHLCGSSEIRLATFEKCALVNSAPRRSVTN